jgi:hypothetical protein
MNSFYSFKPSVNESGTKLNITKLRGLSCGPVGGTYYKDLFQGPVSRTYLKGLKKITQITPDFTKRRNY